MRKSNDRRSRPAVSFLTGKPADSHKSDTAVCAPALLLMAILAGVLPTAGGASDAPLWQSTDSIKQAAEHYIKEHYGRKDARMQSVAGHLDARLRLPRCDAALQAFVRRGTRITSRTIVGVRCTGTKPWKVYVPVDVSVTEAVLVSSRTLPKGHLLSAADVVIEQRDISTFRSGYLSSVDELARRRLKRQVASGRVITPSMLVADVVIRRGQMVTLVVKNDQMQIRMAGRALSDGVLNQRIRVENTNSQRVVEGIVRSPEYVEILVR